MMRRGIPSSIFLGIFLSLVASEQRAQGQVLSEGSGVQNDGWTDITEGALLSQVGPLDEDLFSSVRCAAMSRAVETSADDLDAAMFNPAGIGGYHAPKESPPLLRRLYFPSAAVQANQNAVDLYQEFGVQGGAASAAVGRAIIDAKAGKRQYARAGVTSGIVFGRLMVARIFDHQVAASALGDGSGLVGTRYRGTTGWSWGGSAQSKDETLSLGYSGYLVDRSEIEGTFDYSAFIDADLLKSVVKPYSRVFRGTGHHVGVTWRPPVKRWSPAFAMALKDVGNTRLRNLNGGDAAMVHQNLSLGLSMSPKLTRTSSLLLALGAEKLNDETVAIGRKSHLGLEWAWGGLGNYATWTIRAGLSSGGGSVGMGVHLGLIGLHLALQSVDIGENNQKVIEQRRSVNAYVNVAEF